MGFVEVPVKIVSTEDGRREVMLEMLVDTGAMFTVVPRAVLHDLGVRPRSSRLFQTIEGKPIQRDVGVSEIEVQGEQPPGPVPVVFGDPDVGVVLGVTALESMGLKVNPVAGTLEKVDLKLWSMEDR